MTRSATADRNREAMPETARIVDAFKRTFGAGTRFPWVQEGAEERGKRLPVERSMDANQWVHYVKTGELPCSA
jgi:hypothetical protein